jgi:hypothetical protein
MLEKEIAQHALASDDIRRLMTVPGVSLTTRASDFLCKRVTFPVTVNCTGW